MAERSSKKRPTDVNAMAAQIVGEATGELDPYEGKNPAAVELGRLGGKKGGKARAASLTPEQRSEIARKAAAARWANKATVADIPRAAVSRVTDDPS
ncbi:MAG: hypothetical protein ABIU97_08715 [Dehalococcoidia bacterium]